jgi:uncharacterized protein with GYD domain
MPKYLVRASFTVDGIRGTLKEGGTARRTIVEQLAQSVGSTVEAFYYAFGDHDLYVIFDAPDNVAVATASTTVAATGIAKVETVVLITPEEMDEVARKNVSYRAPGA